MTEFDKVIPPGGVGKVIASLDTSHYRGAIAKTVRVTTNDPATGTVVLELRADVVSAIEVAPSDRPVIRTTLGDVQPTELTVSATNGRVFDILAVKADPSVGVTVRPAPGAEVAAASRRTEHPKGTVVAAGSSRYLLTITPKPDVRVGRSVGNVTLTTNLPKAETVPIRAVLVVAGPLQVEPGSLLVRPAPEGSVFHVKITKRTGDGLRILDVASNDPEFTATVTPLNEGRDYDIAVRYTGKPGRGPVSSRITVKTNEPGQTEVVIPVIGRI